MPTYKVVLKDEAKTELRIAADDVDLDGNEGEGSDGNTTTTNAFFNFVKGGITVAAVPFDGILYIIS
jgi:hypothetical protein